MRGAPPRWVLPAAAATAAAALSCWCCCCVTIDCRDIGCPAAAAAAATKYLELPSRPAETYYFGLSSTVYHDGLKVVASKLAPLKNSDLSETFRGPQGGVPGFIWLPYLISLGPRDHEITGDTRFHESFT